MYKKFLIFILILLCVSGLFAVSTNTDYLYITPRYTGEVMAVNTEFTTITTFGVYSENAGSAMTFSKDRNLLYLKTRSSSNSVIYVLDISNVAPERNPAAYGSYYLSEINASAIKYKNYTNSMIMDYETNTIYMCLDAGILPVKLSDDGLSGTFQDIILAKDSDGNKNEFKNCAVYNGKLYAVKYGCDDLYVYDLKNNTYKTIETPDSFQGYMVYISPDETKLLVTQTKVEYPETNWHGWEELSPALIDLSNNNSISAIGFSIDAADFSYDGEYLYCTGKLNDNTINQSFIKYKLSDGTYTNCLLNNDNCQTLGITEDESIAYCIAEGSGSTNHERAFKVNINSMSLIKSLAPNALDPTISGSSMQWTVCGDFMPSSSYRALTHHHKWKFESEGYSIKAYCSNTMRCDDCEYQGVENAIVLPVGLGSYKPLNIEIYPENATLKIIKRISSDETSIQFDDKGYVKALQKTSGYVGFVAQDGSGISSNTIYVEVTD